MELKGKTEKLGAESPIRRVKHHGGRAPCRSATCQCGSKDFDLWSETFGFTIPRIAIEGEGAVDPMHKLG